MKSEFQLKKILLIDINNWCTKFVYLILLSSAFSVRWNYFDFKNSIYFLVLISTWKCVLWRFFLLVILLVDLLSSNFILVTDYSHGRILQIDLQIGTVAKLPLSVDKPTGLAFDKSLKKLYFSDNSTHTIRSATLHRENTTVFYTPGTCFNMFVKNDCFSKSFIYVIICYSLLPLWLWIF